jgi:hypothetical protein
MSTERLFKVTAADTSGNLIEWYVARPASLRISPSNKQDHCSCGRCGLASYLTCARAKS